MDSIRQICKFLDTQKDNRPKLDPKNWGFLNDEWTGNIILGKKCAKNRKIWNNYLKFSELHSFFWKFNFRGFYSINTLRFWFLKSRILSLGNPGPNPFNHVKFGIFEENWKKANSRNSYFCISHWKSKIRFFFIGGGVRDSRKNFPLFFSISRV